MAMIEPEQKMYYFGCWQQVGHSYWLPGMKNATYKKGPPTPWGWGIDNEVFNSIAWVMERKDGWTAIGTDDRTVDSRPNSHSVFVAEGILTYDAMFDMAEDQFPEVVERLQGARKRPAARTHIGSPTTPPDNDPLWQL